MIKSARFLNGFPLQINPSLKERTFEFKDGFNVLYGENGSLKSSLIKTMAAYCGIKVGGWSQLSEPGQLGYKNIKQFPYVYRAYTPSNIDCFVEWDGTPSFYNDSDSISKNDTTWLYTSDKAQSDGITTEAERMEILAAKPSSGQYRIHKINKIMQIIANPPSLTVVPPHIKNDFDLLKLEMQYIYNLPKQNKVTLLLDEPEKALFLPRQLELFNVLKELSKNFQVIIATHSPFILFIDGVNIIDMQEGQSTVVRDIIKKQITSYNKKKK